jgi:hypothetical protein
MATSKRLTNNGTKASPQPITSITVGLDIGYGVTKCVIPDRAILFPSVLGFSRDIKFRSEELAAKYPGDHVWDDDGEWFVGDLALSQLRPGEQLRLRGRTANENEIGNVFRVRLMKAALGKLLPGHTSGDVVHVRIATGLPVDHMPDAPQLKAALLGQHLIRTDATQFIANVSEVMVMPQPYGTIYANMLTPTGQINDCYTAKRTGVVDIGTYTVDLTLDDNGEYIEAESGSIESGVYTAQERIAAAIERDYREKPGYRLVESVLRTGCLQARGEQIDYSDVVEEALEPLRTSTLNLLGEKWKGGLNVDTISISGGGAHLVQDVITDAYPQARVARDAQLANARGYLQYALFAAQG